MSLITFTSDFGTSDHYVAAVKAKMFSINPSAQIIDISHDINPFDLPHMAFTLQSVFKDFPENTVHLVGINNHTEDGNSYLITFLEGHTFLIPDNGIIGLISSQAPDQVIKIGMESLIDTNFPAKDVLASIAVQLANGKPATTFGELTDKFKSMRGRQVKATKKEIAGHVIRVDHYGNLITNIRKTDFDILSKDKKYVVHFGKERAGQIHYQYRDVEPGDVFFIFNDRGLLEIGINQGSASQLLGLVFDSPIQIQFED